MNPTAEPWRATLVGMTRRLALVTGAARGIGAATAEALAKKGDRVICLDICGDDPNLDYALASFEDLAAVVSACGDDAEGVVGDVRDLSTLAGLLDGYEFDTVVCAAGVVWGGTELWDTPEDVWRQMMAVNLDGVFHTAAVTMPGLIQSDHPGRFVAVASAASSKGLPLMGAYSAAKHGVVGLIRSLSADLADTGVTANAVAPGSTSTAVLDASAAVYGLSDSADFAVHHSSQRLLEPSEVAAAIVWLCSEEASGVTGSVLSVDGGMTAS